jgi:hypothetical protein
MIKIERCVLFVFLAILIGLVIIAAKNTSADLTASDTAYSIGDSYRVGVLSPTGELLTANNTSYIFRYNVTKEEVVGGTLCSVVNMTLENGYFTTTTWVPKAYVLKRAIKSELKGWIAGDCSIINNTITGGVTSIKLGDVWSQMVSTEQWVPVFYGGSNGTGMYMKTTYTNYTEKFTVISDSTIVTVPAGTFTCYVINSTRNDTNNSYIIEYISGKWIVKTEYYTISQNGTSTLSMIQGLVSYSGVSNTTETTKTEIGKEFAFLLEPTTIIPTIIMVVIFTSVIIYMIKRKNRTKTPKSEITPEEITRPTEESAVEWDESAYKPRIVPCRRCMTLITITSPQRPITITCPKCRASGIVRK